MKAQELRIGNYVYADLYDKDYILVESVCSGLEEIYNSTTGEIPLSSIKPIPLTEEILFKCGFEKIGEWNFIKDDKYKIDETIDDGVYSFRIKIGLHDSYYLKYIKYLHQLQNIIHALTNQELEIKL